MTVQEFLKTSEQRLAAAGIATAHLDCLVLLEDATGKDRAWLLAHPEFDVKGSTFHKLGRQVERRIRHEPLAYIRGKSEFYGREFKVSKDTLQPRPETETMTDLLKELIQNSHKSSLLEAWPLTALTGGGGVNWRVVDVGTGSGCLGITAKLEIPDAEVMATDIDPKCLEVARQNAENYKVSIGFYEGNLLEPMLSTFDFRLSTILANLPYIPNNYTINKAAMFEPSLAIFGGFDGLDLYRRLFSQIAELETEPIYIFTESLPTQHETLAKFAKDFGYAQILDVDFIQSFKKVY